MNIQLNPKIEIKYELQLTYYSSCMNTVAVAIQLVMFSKSAWPHWTMENMVWRSAVVWAQRQSSLNY